MIAAFYTLLGPLVGNVGFLLTLIVKSLSIGDLRHGLDIDLGALSNLLLLTFTFAYVIGGMAALLCGIYLAWYAAKCGMFDRWRAGVAGAAAAVSSFLLIAVTLINGTIQSSLGLLFLMLPASVFSSLACRYFLFGCRSCRRHASARWRLSDISPPAQACERRRN